MPDCYVQSLTGVHIVNLRALQMQTALHKGT